MDRKTDLHKKLTRVKKENRLNYLEEKNLNTKDDNETIENQLKTEALREKGLIEIDTALERINKFMYKLLTKE